MKRDLDLIRRILIATEAAECPIGVDGFIGGDHGYSEVVYHVKLLDHHGLIDASVIEDDFGLVSKAVIDGLTWDGQDYLDAIRDDRVWSKTKRAISSAVGSTTMEVVHSVAAKAAESLAFAAL